MIDYSVTVTQTKPDVQAVGVSVTDEIPSCLCLTEGQYAAQTSPGADPCTLTRQGENGWKVTCPTLKYGETITVSFKMPGSGSFQWSGMGKYSNCYSG